MAAWRPELTVDEALVRRLLAQFGQLDVEELALLSEGWDRDVWLVNGAIVFGFPRREAVVRGVAREIEQLPRLAPLVPLAIPVPAFVGEPADDYPWPFFGSRLVPGRESGDAGLDESGRNRIGVEIAAFLRALHDPDVVEAFATTQLPVDPNHRTDMTVRVPRTRTSLLELERSGVWEGTAVAERVLREAERLPPPTETAVVHGDLHFRHVLVAEGHASGVIDWIDLCRADPAIDLQVLWSVVPPSGRERFVAAYGPIDEARLLRARVVALSLAAQLALYGRAEGQQAIAREALECIARTLAD